MNTAKTTTITAWKDWQEWSDVYDLIHKQSHCTQNGVRALQGLRLWRNRGLQLPVGVVATSDIIEVLLVVSKAPVPTHTHRLAMGMAIVRFVNSCVDVMRDNSEYPKSVSDVALQLGLHQSFVNLRHQATHSSMPAFAILQNACEDALIWLLNKYWCNQHIQLQRIHQHIHQALHLLHTTAKALSRGAVFNDAIAIRLRPAILVLQNEPHTLVRFLVDDAHALLRCPRSDVSLNPINIENAFNTLWKVWSAIIETFAEHIHDLYDALLLSLTMITLNSSSSSLSSSSSRTMMMMMMSTASTRIRWRAALAMNWAVACIASSSSTDYEHCILPAVISACLSHPCSYALDILLAMHSRLQRLSLVTARHTALNDAIDALQHLLHVHAGNGSGRGGSCNIPPPMTHVNQLTASSSSSSTIHHWTLVCYAQSLPLGLLPDGSPSQTQATPAFGSNMMCSDNMKDDAVTISSPQDINDERHSDLKHLQESVHLLL